MRDEHIEIEKVFQGLTESISEDFVNDLRRRVKVIRLQKNERLFVESDLTRQLYFIINGSCVRLAVNPKGEERAVMFHTESFCPMLSGMYIGRKNSAVHYFVRANEPTVLLRFDSTFSHEWLARSTKVGLYTYDRALEYISILSEWQNHLLALCSEDLLRWLMNHYGFLFQRFRSQDIASFVGITPTWLSRLKRKIMQKN